MQKLEDEKSEGVTWLTLRMGSSHASKNTPVAARQEKEVSFPAELPE